MPFNKEQSRHPELNQQLVEAYNRTFIHRLDCYPVQLDEGNYVTLHRPLKPEMVIAHIKGILTLGVYALNKKSIAHWLCLDADEDEIWQQLIAVAQRLEVSGLISYLEPSRRGGHLWLFTPPTPGKIVREFGKGLVHRYSLTKLEIYPKQDELKTGTGSLVRLPLGVHRKSGKRYHFLQVNGEPLAPTIREQMAILAKPELVPITFINQIRAELPKPSPPLPQLLSLQQAEVSSGEHLSERLKKAIGVYDFVSRYVELDAHLKGICPFHDDHIKSFQVNQSGNYWSCYAGCGGGSIIDFWGKWRETHSQDGSFTATIKDLAALLFS